MPCGATGRRRSTCWRSARACASASCWGCAGGTSTSTPGAAADIVADTANTLKAPFNAYRETVTKVINQFRDARLLDVDNSGITLLNPSRLRELSQS